MPQLQHSQERSLQDNWLTPAYDRDRQLEANLAGSTILVPLLQLRAMPELSESVQCTLLKICSTSHTVNTVFLVLTGSLC